MQADAITAAEYPKRFAELDRLLADALPQLADVEAIAEAVDAATERSTRQPHRPRARLGGRAAGSVPQQPRWLDRAGAPLVCVAGVIIVGLAMWRSSAARRFATADDQDALSKVL